MTQHRRCPVPVKLLCTFTLAFLPWLVQAEPAKTASSPSTSSDGVKLDTVNVTAKIDPNMLMEDQLIGPNQQPLWTTARRFATTRIYVLAPWELEVEQWWKGKFPDGASNPIENLFQTEYGMGLPYRFQLDLYENYGGNNSDIRQDSMSVELRYALANWGKIPLNPTLYAEWKFGFNGNQDTYELKLLLGDEFGPRWHWGFNYFYEKETGGTFTTETGFAQGISYTVLDDKLSIGLEMNFEYTYDNANPSTTEFLIGPSLQWRPTSNTHLDITPLIGATQDSPMVETYIIFGIDFGPGSPSSGKGYKPVSTQSR